MDNNLLESNRRLPSPLSAGEKIGRTVDAQESVLGGGRSANRYANVRAPRGRWARYVGIIAVLLVGVLHAQDFTYTNSNGTITITGYTGPGGNVTIPASIEGLAVTAIGGLAFGWNTNITAITIPDSVTNIENDGFSGAFESCVNLARVNLPESLTTISPLAFANCQSLTNITLPASITEIGRFSFMSCTNLAGVYCKGDAPVAEDGAQVFDFSSNVTVYYLPGTSGWGSTLGGRPTMLWNPQFQSDLAPSSGSLIGFNIIGTAGIPLVLDATTDLASPAWSPLLSITLVNGYYHFSDPLWKQYPRRFYRIRSP